MEGEDLMADEHGLLMNPGAAMKVLDYEAFKALNQKALDQHLNRAVDPEWFEENVSKQGVSVLTPVMLHEHIAGKASPPHYRCRILFPQTTEDPDLGEPGTVYLDVWPTDFDSLPTVGQWRERHT